jgi:hypothetical protein
MQQQTPTHTYPAALEPSSQQCQTIALTNAKLIKITPS